MRVPTLTTRVFRRTLILALPTIGLYSAGAQKSASSDTSRLFHDDRIRVAVPPGWTAKEVTITTQGGRHIPSRIGEVLGRGKYRVYLLTHYGRASGIAGGRFGEIAGYVAPWMHTDDSGACFDALQPSTTPVTNLLSRIDLYFDSNSRSASETCKHLQSPTEQPVWFGSYFSPRYEYGFFLSFPLGQTQADPDHEMVFTATLATKNANELPIQNDSELHVFLREASAIVSSIKYRE